MQPNGMPSNQPHPDCLGCAIALGRLLPPGGRLGESEHFVVHQDPEVPIRGFLIIASKRHLRSIAEMSAAEAAELFALVHRARLAQA